MGLFRKLQKKPTLFLSTTGMQLKRFEQLLPEFEKAYSDHLRANHAELLASVKTEKWSDEIAKKFDDVCAAYVKEFNA